MFYHHLLAEKLLWWNTGFTGQLPEASSSRHMLQYAGRLSDVWALFCDLLQRITISIPYLKKLKALKLKSIIFPAMLLEDRVAERLRLTRLILVNLQLNVICKSQVDTVRCCREKLSCSTGEKKNSGVRRPWSVWYKAKKRERLYIPLYLSAVVLVVVMTVITAMPIDVIGVINQLQRRRLWQQ